LFARTPNVGSSPDHCSLLGLTVDPNAFAANYFAVTIAAPALWVKQPEAHQPQLTQQHSCASSESPSPPAAVSAAV
jgi:hypothetical protein